MIPSHHVMITAKFNELFEEIRASLVAQTVKNLSIMWETQVLSLGWKDPPEKGTTHSSTLVWRIPRTEEPGKLQSIGS